MRKFIFTSVITIIISISYSSFSYLSAQEQPFRIGLKFGFPQLAGLNLEYVTPLLQKRLAADVDFSYISLKPNTNTVTYTNFAIGANYYFFREGKGLYGGIGYDQMGIKASGPISTTENETTTVITGNFNTNLNNLVIKIGGKHGGLLYFRWELGYMIALNTPTYILTGTTTKGTVETKSFNFVKVSQIHFLLKLFSLIDLLSYIIRRF